MMLDSGTTCSLFGNPDLVTNIKQSSDPIQLQTNAGTATVSEEATVANFGIVRFSSDAIANIFGLSDIKKTNRVTLDTAREDAFVVHGSDNEPDVRFMCDENGLYVYEPSAKYIEGCEKANKKRNAWQMVLMA